MKIVGSGRKLSKDRQNVSFCSNRFFFFPRVLERQLFQGFESFITNSSHPADVARVILNAVDSPSPELRYLVGKDAESLFKARKELSDRELERWVRASFMEEKGFVRQ